MPTILEPAPDEVLEHCRAVAQQYHPELVEAGVTFAVLMAENEDGPAVKVHGWPCAAKVKVNNLEQRTQGMADATITIDSEQWTLYSSAQCEALLDHELEHLVLAKDKDGAVKRDDLNRPKLRCRPHDYELAGFVSVAKRHGREAVEVAEAKKFRERFGQYLLFDDGGK